MGGQSDAHAHGRADYAHCVHRTVYTALCMRTVYTASLSRARARRRAECDGAGQGWETAGWRGGPVSTICTRNYVHYMGVVALCPPRVCQAPRCTLHRAGRRRRGRGGPGGAGAGGGRDAGGRARVHPHGVGRAPARMVRRAVCERVT
jgi:hypothetical protein